MLALCSVQQTQYQLTDYKWSHDPQTPIWQVEQIITADKSYFSSDQTWNAVKLNNNIQNYLHIKIIYIFINTIIQTLNIFYKIILSCSKGQHKSAKN